MVRIKPVRNAHETQVKDLLTVAGLQLDTDKAALRSDSLYLHHWEETTQQTFTDVSEYKLQRELML